MRERKIHKKYETFSFIECKAICHQLPNNIYIFYLEKILKGIFFKLGGFGLKLIVCEFILIIFEAFFKIYFLDARI